jgi:hypothetical protein
VLLQANNNISLLLKDFATIVIFAFYAFLVLFYILYVNDRDYGEMHYLGIIFHECLGNYLLKYFLKSKKEGKERILAR